MVDIAARHCGHLKDVNNFCEYCIIFLCEECVIDHLTHLSAIISDDHAIINYLSHAKETNIQIRAHLKQLNIQLLKEELYRVMYFDFQAIKGFVEIEDLKLKWEESLWKAFMSTSLYKKIESNREELKTIEKDLKGLILSVKRGMDQQIAILIITNGIFNESKKKIMSFMGIMESSKQLDDFDELHELEIIDDLTSVEFRAPWLKEAIILKKQGIIGYNRKKAQKEIDKAKITSNRKKVKKLYLKKRRKINQDDEELEAWKRKYNEEVRLIKKRHKEENDRIDEELEVAEHNLTKIKSGIKKRKEKEVKAKEEFKETEIYGDFKEDIICPITHEIMTDPVIATDGRTYERKAIMHWFKYSDKSPCTNLVIDHKLIPNFQFKNLIQTIRKI